MCRRAGIDPDSHSGVQFGQALTLRRVMSLSARLTALEERPTTSTANRSNRVVRLRKEPLFENRGDVVGLVDLDTTTRDWLNAVGGNTPKDHITRVFNGLFSVALQRDTNRTGGFGKMKLPGFIEKLVSDACRSIFPNETVASVERLIIRFFKSAGDRGGGRKERKKNTLPTPAPDAAGTDCEPFDSD